MCEKLEDTNGKKESRGALLRRKKMEIYQKAQAERRELSLEEKIFLCTDGVDLSRPIYQIFKWKYLKKDLEKNTLTLPCISLWCRMDSYEAFPFKEPEWQRIRNSYYGLAFSLNGLDYVEIDDKKCPIWQVYDEIHNGSDSEGSEPQIRVATTVGDLLRAISQYEDENFHVKVALGRVEYTNDLAKPSYSLFHLGDAVGVGDEILFKKKVECSWEHEVRLIYNNGEFENCSLKLNIPVSELFHHVQFPPNLTNEQKNEFEKTLLSFGFSIEQFVEKFPNARELKVECDDTYELPSQDLRSEFHQGSPCARSWAENLCKSSTEENSKMSEKSPQ